jgi:hypothetical protein
MQRSSCGHQNAPGSLFCVTCGMPLSQGSQAAAVQQPHFNMQNAGPGGVGWQSPPTINQPLPVSPPQQPLASMPSSAPIQYGKHGGFEGVARNIQRSSEQVGNQQTTQILRFNLEQFDQSGNRTMMMSVEMRGLSIIGNISEGDRVEVFGQREGGLILAKEIQNVTTDSRVKTEGITTAMKVFMAIFAIFGLVILALVGYIFVSVLVLHRVPFGPPVSFGPPNNFGTPSTLVASPDAVLNSYCSDLRSGAYQWAYDQYSTRLKSEVSPAQLSQMWSGKFIDSCTHDSAQVSGKQAMTTLSITAKILANQVPPPEQTYTYHIVLVQDGSNGWKIDRIQSL